METASQIGALAIFILMFIVITTGKVPRYIPALVGGALTILVVFLLILREPQAVVRVLNLGQIGTAAFWYPGHIGGEISYGVNWQTIIFIAGMMIMVGGLAEVGFFRWLCLYVARLVNYKVVPILVAFMLLSGFLSMFIDSITVMLFLATVTIELAHLLKFNPVPIIIAEIFASNVGGSATMSGDPPNIIIGTALGYSFFDFLRDTGPIAWIGMAVTLVFFYFMFRRQLLASQEEPDEHRQYPDPAQAITDRTHFLINAGIFLLVIALLVTHAQSGISVATIGVIAAVLTLGFAAIKRTGRHTHIISRLDWQTLLFFFGLFVCVGGLEETGVLTALAKFIGNAAGGSLTLVLTIILWVSAFASAIIDNIPFAATMVPVIVNLSRVGGFALPPQAWALALGTDIGGNGTPIGASANVVGTAIAEKAGYPISWGRYCRYALPAMILVVGICWGYLILRYT